MWTAVVAATSGLLNFAMDRTTASQEGQDELNGEQVEKKARDLQWLEFVRTGISGVGFAMGVVGIWGDGAGRR
jgi:autophagy-related protein 33